MKYILKESELKSLLEKIIAEEISQSTRINEGFGRFLKNVGKVALGATVAPTYMLGKGVKNFGNLITPTGDETIKSSYRNFKKFLGFQGKSKEENTENEKNGQQQEKQKGKESEVVNKSNIRKKYGEPETVGNMGSRPAEKEDIIVDDFLGSGKSETFKKHYKEKNQERSNSIFNKKLEELKKACGYNSERGKKLFESWLVERDSAYENYFRG